MAGTGIEVTERALVKAAEGLARAVDALAFAAPVAVTYNPLVYAWAPHREYLSRYGATPRKALFLGMNPGPFGMVQTGVPFGDITAARDWLGISGAVQVPRMTHPKRPIHGFECSRGEVSGQRLWGLFKARFGTPDRFFADHFVANYCPLAFVEESGRNRTPDKLAPEERRALFALCDEHLREVVRVLRPAWVVGVGDFAAARATEALEGIGTRVGKILHPSPACPAANRDWAGHVTRQLEALGIW